MFLFYVSLQCLDCYVYFCSILEPYYYISLKKSYTREEKTVIMACTVMSDNNPTMQCSCRVKAAFGDTRYNKNIHLFSNP